VVSKADLDRLRADVFLDPELAARLRRIDSAHFADEVCRLAGERGLDVTAADVDHATAAAQRAWMLRWIR
jgi:hypothetical protein